MKHKDIVPPLYLLENDMLSEEYVKGRRFSVEDRENHNFLRTEKPLDVKDAPSQTVTLYKEFSKD